MKTVCHLILIIVVSGLLGCMGQKKESAMDTRADLRVYGSHRLEAPLTRIIAAFETENGLKVSRELGCGIPKLIPDLKAKQDGDVLVAGEQEELKQATDAGLVASSSTIAWNPFVIVVKKGNPLGIKTPGDLNKPGTRLALPQPGGGCVSRLSDQLVATWGLSEPAGRALRNDKGCKSTVGSEMVAKGEVDATFTWRIVAYEVAGIEMIPIEKAKGAPCECFGIIIKGARHPAYAEKFVTYLLSEKAQSIFCEAGMFDVNEK